MSGVIAWLQAPVFTGLGVARGAAAAFAALALAVVPFLLLRRKRKQRAHAAPDGSGAPVTGRPKAARNPPVEAANLQGIGQREEQQDAFGLSSLAAYEKQGMLAVLCDGMGGMAQGREIAQAVAADILARFPLGDEEAISSWHEALASINRGVCARHGGNGGTTLVMAYLLLDKLWCWSVGDSDIFLLRENRLYAVNQRHEYLNDLFAKALDGALPLAQALEDPQRGALSRYIGHAQFGCDFTIDPFPLKDGDALLLCSDGVSDTLSLHELHQALMLPPEACCAELERGILAAEKANQDNYTAIAINFHFNSIHSDCGGVKHE